MGTCDRCHKPTTAVTGSWFSTEMICTDCSVEESGHPDCAYAKEVENQACARGNYNFKGVGWCGPKGRVPRK